MRERSWRMRGYRALEALGLDLESVEDAYFALSALDGSYVARVLARWARLLHFAPLALNTKESQC